MNTESNDLAEKNGSETQQQESSLKSQKAYSDLTQHLQTWLWHITRMQLTTSQRLFSQPVR